MEPSLSENAVFVPRVAKPLSFDPLDADKTVNLAVMRMLNLTPLEVSVSNRLTSQLLSEFSYSPESAVIRFKVRPNLLFSDGTIIGAEDVAFAVARMAYTRPSFPVISEIKGLRRWIADENALANFPEGIEVRDSEIYIHLNRNVANPLFRFTLEIFSVVPRKSVDVSTNKLKMSRPPNSGNYEIRSESEDAIELKGVFRLPKRTE